MKVVYFKLDVSLNANFNPISYSEHIFLIPDKKMGIKGAQGTVNDNIIDIWELSDTELSCDYRPSENKWSKIVLHQIADYYTSQLEKLVDSLKDSEKQKIIRQSQIDSLDLLLKSDFNRLYEMLPK